jgi:hypothetical protein
MTAVEQVELVNTVEAVCQFGCPWMRLHDREAGDRDDPTFEVRAHVADTGHTVTVTRLVRVVTEYRESDVFTDLTGQRDERGAA